MSKKHEPVVDKDLADFDDENESTASGSGGQEGQLTYPSHEELDRKSVV
jgi:hypothetical protein